MTDLSTTIAPKSDQLNADDLIGGRTMTITITKVSKSDTPDQPISIHFDGDNGKPYKPCKSMRRVLVHVWGADGNQYIGRSLTLYRDESVKFGGLDVGGLRISHMSHMANNKSATLALTASKANRKPYTVKPLVVDTKATQPQLPYTNSKGITIQVAGLEKWLDMLQAFVNADREKAMAANMENAAEVCKMIPDAEKRVNAIFAEPQNILSAG